MERKIFKVDTGRNASAVFVFAEQQVEKCGLASAVSSRKAQLPIGIDLKAYVFENVVVAAVIGKRQVGHFDQRHDRILLHKNRKTARKLPFLQLK
jgi:cyanophycinase-like exopeptidase